MSIHPAAAAFSSKSPGNGAQPKSNASGDQVRNHMKRGYKFWWRSVLEDAENSTGDLLVNKSCRSLMILARNGRIYYCVICGGCRLMRDIRLQRQVAGTWKCAGRYYHASLVYPSTLCLRQSIMNILPCPQSSSSLHPSRTSPREFSSTKAFVVLP
jgi:hypothetical protein